VRKYKILDKVVAGETKGRISGNKEKLVVICTGGALESEGFNRHA